MPVICVFEDECHQDLLPLVYCRPAYELRCGMTSLLEKIVGCYEQPQVTLLCRNYLADTLRERVSCPVNEIPGDEDVLFLNGRLLLHEAVPVDGPEEIALWRGAVVYARLRAETVASVRNEHFLSGTLASILPRTMRHVEREATLLRYYWEIVGHNEAELVRDFEARGRGGELRGTLHEGVHVLGRENLFVGEGAVIKPGCVLDAEEGPIYIAEGAKVMPGTCIQGPTYIGPGSTIQMAARLREGTNIGAVCKVGGEIENSILHSFSNKQHDGFLGHAYVCQWVNLAADTINSDLKNTYGTVRVQLPHKLVETGSMFVGLAMGDHSKSAIASTFVTGAVVGFCCNVLAAGFPPKFIPSFSWLTDGSAQPYSTEVAIEVAQRVVSRRKQTITDADAALFHKIYDLTRAERDALGMEE